MATQWYYQSDDDERGPVGFSDLVQMICDEVLSEDDLVRPAYQSEWQRVDSVPGLLHMARRKQRQEARGDRQEATEKRQEATEKRQEATEKRQEATGNRQQVAGDRQEATGKSSDEDVIAEVIEGAVGAGGSEQIDRSDWSWFDWLFYYLVPDWLVASRAPPVPEFSSEKLKDWQPASGSEPVVSLNQAPVQGSERPGRVSKERVGGGSRGASMSPGRSGAERANQGDSAARLRDAGSLERTRRSNQHAASEGPGRGQPARGGGRSDRMARNQKTLESVAHAPGEGTQTPEAIAGAADAGMSDGDWDSDAQIHEAIGEAVSRLDARRAALSRRERRRTMRSGVFNGVSWVILGLVRIVRAPIGWLEAAAAAAPRLLRLERFLDAVSKWMHNSRWFRHAFRWTCGLISANGLLLWFQQWQETESLRFPESEAWSQRGHVLPFLGPCAPAEYWFLLIDAVIVAGVAGYVLAAWLETHAEE